MRRKEGEGGREGSGMVGSEEDRTAVLAVFIMQKTGRCGREASVGQAGLGRDSSNLILF